MKRRLFLFVCLLFFISALRFFQISKIPGEWYGDISNVHEYVQEILAGKWPFYFFQSPGPFYHYLIAPVVLIFNGRGGYDTYKTASIFVSLIGLWATYLFAREIGTRRLAFVAVCIQSFSLWFLIWSRIGNSQIVIPVLSGFLGFFTIRFIKRNQFRDGLAAFLVGSLGWYTYPQTFIFVPVTFLYLLFHMLFTKTTRRAWLYFVLFFIFSSLLVLPFIQIVNKQPDNFGTSGYVGQKIIPVFKLNPQLFITKLYTNLKKTYLMLHAAGDKTFRVNVSGHPHLDRISGLLFFLGLLYFFKKKNYLAATYSIFMLVLLPLPSVSPAIPDGEIPNSARTIAVTPFVYLMVAAGFVYLFDIFHHHFSNRCASILATILIMYIVFINLKLYFLDYVNGLPEHNLAPSYHISDYIDTNFASPVSVYFAQCCWGAWGQPEPKAVAYSLKKKRKFVGFTQLIQSCNDIVHKPALVMLHPLDPNLTSFSGCNVSRGIDIMTNNGVSVARFAYIE